MRKEFIFLTTYYSAPIIKEGGYKSRKEKSLEENLELDSEKEISLMS